MTLAEGGTPLQPAKLIPTTHLYLKNETRNPTGAQKDRAVSVAISMAVELGAKLVITASTGSSGLSCSAYAAKAGLPCVVLVSSDAPVSRTALMAAYGARVVEVPGPFAETARLLEGLDSSSGWYKASTNRRTNPYQADGARTIAFEIVAQLGGVPDWCIVPVGGGSTLASIWRGFLELSALGQIERLPVMVAVQPAGFDTVRRAVELRLSSEEQIRALPLQHEAQTLQINLKSGFRSDLADVVDAIWRSKGTAIAVSDSEVLNWQTKLAREEGVLAEPSGAAGLAAAARLADSRMVSGDDVVVVVVTGSGMRQQGIYADTERVKMQSACNVTDLMRLVDHSL